MRVEVNAGGWPDKHLDALRQCFPGWGDEAKYAWYFAPREPFPTPDALVVRDGTEMVAGTGLTYRTLLRPEGSQLKAAILTGSWTLPAFRGRGLFGQIVEASLRLRRTKRFDALLAFVREDNPSRTVLERAGARLIPTHYFRSGSARAVSESRVNLSPVPADPLAVEALWRRFSRQGDGCFRFHYETAAAFASQFIHRHSETNILRDEEENQAVIQDDGNQSLALFVAMAGRERDSGAVFLRALDEHAGLKNRSLVTFTGDGELRAACEEAGFTRTGGFLAVICETNSPLDAPWRLSGADRS